MIITMEIPWPPSVNHYYRHVGPKVLISREGQRYREVLTGRIRQLHIQPFEKTVRLILQFYPPDRRRRDIDNLLKCLFDSFTAGGLWKDDSLVRRLDVEMLEPMPPHGLAVARVMEYETKISAGKKVSAENNHGTAGGPGNAD